MKAVVLLPVVVWFCCGSVADAEEAWTPVPNCGPRPPAANDIIAGSELWQCAKSEFAKSQGEYQTAVKLFESRVPEAEKPKFYEHVARWDYDDQKKCTKRNSLDFGCTVVANYERARMLNEAVARCDADACHVSNLP